MIHTYRDDRFLDSRFADLDGYVLAWLIVASWVPAAIVERLDRGFTLGDALIVLFWSGVALAVARGFYWHYCYRRCGEIRLSDDGTCELETKRGVIRLHASELRGVKYYRDDDSGRESYTILCRGGRLKVSDRITGFDDFLARLATLNPALELTNFPNELVYRIGATAGRRRGSLARRIVTSVLFPFFVFVLLVWLAIQILMTK